MSQCACVFVTYKLELPAEPVYKAVLLAGPLRQNRFAWGTKRKRRDRVFPGKDVRLKCHTLL